MNPPVLLPALVFCLFTASQINAQQNRFQPEKQTFAVGLAPFSLILPGGKLNLRGEWAYSRNRSFSLLVGIPRPTPAPALISSHFDLSDNVTATANRLTTFGVVLEHRFYVGQNAMRGFYFAPYSRYTHFCLERKTQSAGSQFITTVKGVAQGFGVGAAAGVQFRLGDFLTLDATLAGVDFKWLNSTFTYASDDPEINVVTFRDKVQQTLAALPIIGSKLNAAVDGNAVKVQTLGLVAPAFRFNLTVNYVF